MLYTRPLVLIFKQKMVYFFKERPEYRLGVCRYLRRMRRRRPGDNRRRRFREGANPLAGSPAGSRRGCEIRARGGRRRPARRSAPRWPQPCRARAPRRGGVCGAGGGRKNRRLGGGGLGAFLGS